MLISVIARAVFAFFAVLAYTQFSHAQDFQLGRATIAGTGCPAGTASVALSPDQKSISVLFDQFVIQQPAGVAQAQRIVCHLRIDVNNITPGYILDTTTFDFRGFTQLPAGANATFITRGGAEGAGRDNRVREQINSSGDFQITRVAEQAAVRGCKYKRSDMIKLDVALILDPNGRVTQEDGMIALDSADLGDSTSMKVGVALKQCDAKNGKIKDIFKRIFENNGKGRFR